MFRRLSAVLALLIGTAGAVVVTAGAGPAQADVRPAAGQYVPVTPVRTVVDQSLDPLATYALSPLGTAGVPTGGVSAVAFRLSALSDGAGWLEAFPAGVTRPSASQLNYLAKTPITNAVVSKLGTNGQVSIYSGGASVAVKFSVEIVGYYTTAGGSTAGSTFVPLTPVRITPTALTVTAGGTVSVAPLGAGGIPATNVTAVVAHVTITSTAKVAGQATVYPSGTTKPGTVDLYYGADPAYTNQVTAVLGTDGKFLVHSTQAGTVTVDIAGYYQKPAGTAAGTSFVGVTPARVIPATILPTLGTATFAIAGAGGVPATGAAAVAINITANEAASPGALCTFAADTTRPVVRQLSYRKDGSWPTLQVSKLSADGKISIYNSGAGSVRLLGDVLGYFLAPDAPAAPSGAHALPADGSATVTWAAPAADGGASITKYTAIASPGGATATATAGSTSVSVPGLTNGVPYTFTVTATNAAGTSAPSAPSDPITPAVPAPPGQPFITGTLPRDGAASVTWSPPPAGASTVTAYLIKATPGTASVQVDGALTQAVLTGLTNGTAYRFTVAAINGNGTGTPSEQSPPVVPSAAQPPLKPAVTAVIALGARVDLQWVAPPDGGGDITGYTVTVNPGARVITVAAGTTVASVTGLTNGTATTFAVAAVNKAGAGPATTVTATPVASRVPMAPGDVRASVSAAGQLTAAWSAPSDPGTSAVTGYTVTATPGGATVSAAATATSAVLTGLSQTTAYSLVVTANSAAGTGVASAPTSAVLPKVTVKVAPVVLSAASIATLQSVRQDGTLQFAQPPAQVTALRAGSLVIITQSALTPRGFYGRVTQVGTSAETFVVNTVPAGIDEAFTDGALAADGQLSNADVASFTALAPGVRLAEPTIGGRTVKQGAAKAPAATAAVVAPNIGIRDGALVLEFETEPRTDDRGISNRIEIQTAIKPTYTNTLKISLLDGVKGTFTVGAETKNQIQTKIGYVAEFEPEYVLGRIRGTCITVPIGIVPVVMCPEFVLGVKLKFAAGGGYSISLSYNRTFTAGLSFSGGSVSPTGSSTTDGAPEQTVNVFGEGSVEGDVPISLILYFYGAVGPEVEIVPYAEFFADTTQNPWWEARAGLRVNAALKSVKFFGVKFEFESENIVNVFVTLAKAGGAYSGIKITPAGSRTTANTPLDFGVTVVGWPDTIPIEWSVTKGAGTIDANGVYTSATVGTAEIKAHSPAGAGRPAMDATTSVLVGAAPPSAPRALTATQGNLSATVKWTAPASTNGAAITGYVITTQPATGAFRVPATATSAQVKGLGQGIGYLIQVAATNSAGTGAPGTTDAPIQPLDDSFLPVGTTPVNIAAADPNLAITQYWGNPVLSRTGRFVVFPVQPNSPLAPAALIGAASGDYLIRYDLVTKETALVSRAADGKTPEPGTFPSIDSSGNIVSYLVADSDSEEVMVNNLARNTVTPVITNTTGGYTMMTQKISADGTTIIVETEAPGFDGMISRVKVGSETVARVTRCWVKYNCTRGPYTEDGKRMSISGDGRYVLFVEEVPLGGGSSYTGNFLYDANTATTTELPTGSVDSDEIQMSALSADGTTTAGFVGSYTVSSGPYVRRGLTTSPKPSDVVHAVDLDGTEWITPQLSDDGKAALMYHKSSAVAGDEGWAVWNQGTYTAITGLSGRGAISGDGRVVAHTRRNQSGVWLQRVL